ncbi:hypothetical protein ACFW96_11415 [Streptomyces gardneri]
MVTAAITITVQLVMGGLQLYAARRLTRITLEEQRKQPDVMAAHALVRVG